MKITLEVTTCKECPNLVYTMDGLNCSKLKLSESYVLERGGRDKIVENCPLLNEENYDNDPRMDEGSW